jgi:hypothetical protein
LRFQAALGHQLLRKTSVFRQAGKPRLEAPPGNLYLLYNQTPLFGASDQRISLAKPELTPQSGWYHEPPLRSQVYLFPEFSF